MIPKHIAIIMDGNGRWAESKKKPRIEGHQAGVENITRVVEIMISKEVKFLTLFAFSTENWSRPVKEVKFLTGKLLAKSISSHTEKLNSAGYLNYEISNWAKKGKQSLHNLCYWKNNIYSWNLWSWWKIKL